MIPYDSQIARLLKRKPFPQRSAPRKWIWIGTCAGLLLLCLSAFWGEPRTPQ